MVVIMDDKSPILLSFPLLLLLLNILLYFLFQIQFHPLLQIMSIKQNLPLCVLSEAESTEGYPPIS